MAFSCESCINRIEGPNHYNMCFGSVFKSFGRCEDCGELKDTIDCKCYKQAGWKTYQERLKERGNV